MRLRGAAQSTEPFCPRCPERTNEAVPRRVQLRAVPRPAARHAAWLLGEPGWVIEALLEPATIEEG